MNDQIRKVLVSCNKDCGGGCPLVATVENGKIIKIGNSPYQTPYMNGCIRGFGMTKAINHPKRVTTPLKRVGKRGEGKFEPISWEQALDEVAEKLEFVAKNHGEEAVFLSGGSGSCRGIVHNTSALAQRFFGLFGGYTGCSDTYSYAAINFATPFVVGNESPGFDPVHLKKTKQIILWGANIIENIFGCETPGYLREAKKNNIPIIVIDPRETDTVKQLASQWISIRPGTDSVLMMALLYEIITQFKPSESYIETYSVGYQMLEDYILGKEDGIVKDPQWAEKICDVSAKVIKQLAADYAKTSPTAMIPGFSYQRALGGEEAVRLGIILQFLTQNFGIVGGSSGSSYWGGLPSPQINKIPTGRNPKECFIPVYSWADAVLGGKKEGYPSNIKCLYTIGGNFMVQGSDIAKNIRAFEAVDLVVTHDYFMTDTAKYSDYILPTTTFLEREDVTFSSFNYMLYSAKAVDPIPNVKNDYDILCELACRLGFGEQFSENKTSGQWLEDALERSEIEDIHAFKSTGLYYGKYNQGYTAFSKFMKDPKNAPLGTPSGKIEIFSKSYEKFGFPGIPVPRPPKKQEAFPLQLITPKHRTHTHSQIITERSQMIWVNPEDAISLKIKTDQVVNVTSSVNSIQAPVFITNRIRPGVVALESGLWPEFEKETEIKSGAANWLTSTEPTLPSRGSRTHTHWIKISPL